MQDCSVATSETTPVISVDLIRAAKRSEDAVSAWDDARLRRAATDYERFLHLAARYPGEALAPTRDIDALWHLHMLHPVAYAKDTTRLLGHILDHDGGFGKAAEELPLLKQVFARTSELWEHEFGAPYRGGVDAMTKCVRDCQSRCWHACKSVHACA